MAEGGWGSGTWGQAGWGDSVYDRTLAETATGADSAASNPNFASAVSETSTGADTVSALATFVVCCF